LGLAGISSKKRKGVNLWGHFEALKPQYEFRLGESAGARLRRKKQRARADPLVRDERANKWLVEKTQHEARKKGKGTSEE